MKFRIYKQYFRFSNTFRKDTMENQIFVGKNYERNRVNFWLI